MTMRGRLLVATPRLLDPRFVETVILICEHGSEGALGLVLNRTSDLPVAEVLAEWSTTVTRPDVVFFGGPVQPEIAVALADAAHSLDPLAGLDAGMVVLDDVAGVPDKLRIFSGYAGWGQGQLEAELEEGSWWLVDADAGDIFTSEPGDLRRTVLRRQHDNSAFFAHYPPRPGLN